ncbi:MAG: SDR family oxidoreductase [Nocardioidaceae bacterium]
MSPRLEVAVTAGHGKTGRAVAAALARHGAAARLLGRSAFSDLDAALAGCAGVYLLAPNMHPDEPAYVAAVLDAARRVGVPRVVYHSVVAPYAPDMPHHLGKAVAEDLVRRSGSAWTVLQPCAYVQNFVPPLRGDAPVLRVAYDPDRVFGLVDLDDVGEAAARVLLEEGHAGATYELGGPALVSVADVAAAAGRVLGRDVPVERVSVEEWARTDGAGLDPRVRGGLAAMFAYYDRHGLPAGPLPLRALLGREPTALADTLAAAL